MNIGSDSSDPDKRCRVFNTYAHESDQHPRGSALSVGVPALCGIDAKLDLPAAEQRQDWPWVADQVRDVDHILVIVSTTYRRRAKGRTRSEEGGGAQWEAQLIRDVFYADPHDLGRLAPVVLYGQSREGVSDFLPHSSATVYAVRVFTETGAESLLRLLTNQPTGEVEPLPGPEPLLPRRDHSPLRLSMHHRIDLHVSLDTDARMRIDAAGRHCAG
ncbi:MAG TPA: hypothetical protein VFX16_27430 [Pseudonocardiaceae bacterium]|nr:hypothetical protein [Pseudonocardiaceae bacterium]